VKSIVQLLETKSPEVLLVTPNTSVFDAAKLMAEKDIGLLVVLENGRLRGLISERDCVRKGILQEKPPKDTPVSEIMTKEVITNHSGAAVHECEKLMINSRIRHLPVMEGEKCIGMLSLGDLLSEMSETQLAALAMIGKAQKGHFWV
jgi:CBS domain-containing protein